MSTYSILGNLLATIPGYTLGTNVFTAESPLLDPTVAPPYIKVFRIDAHQEYSLDGLTRSLNMERWQITMTAASQVALSALLVAVQGKMDGNHASFKACIPLGLGPDGHDSVPETYWLSGDWLIVY